MHQAVNYKYYKYRLYLHAYLFIKFKFINIMCYFSGFWHVLFPAYLNLWLVVIYFLYLNKCLLSWIILYYFSWKELCNCINFKFHKTGAYPAFSSNRGTNNLFNSFLKFPNSLSPKRPYLNFVLSISTLIFFFCYFYIWKSYKSNLWHIIGIETEKYFHKLCKTYS